ncbi:MAG: sigma-54-dependent Fis family transcriptional regulator, partial [Planctomycetota bacterium]
MAKIQLTSNDRGFFQLVSDAAAINPFSEERASIDRKISGISGADTRQQRVLYAVEAIRQRLKKLDANQLCQFNDFCDKDKDLMRYTFLFDVYHTYVEQFDAFIVRQELHGPAPLKIPFGPEAINALLLRGFSQ